MNDTYPSRGVGPPLVTNLSAVSQVRPRHPAASLSTVTLDLASLESVRTAAADVLTAHDRLNLLVDNVGVMRLPATTADGFERQFGTNHRTSPSRGSWLRRW